MAGIESVQDVIPVTCLYRCSVSSKPMVDPMPTQQAVPQRSSTCSAACAAVDAPEVSRLLATPRPSVSSRMASSTESTSPGFTACHAPNCRERSNRDAEMSSAMTRAPIALASWVAASPTGPCPKIAMVSSPLS